MPNNVFANQLAVRKLMQCLQRLRRHTGIVSGDAGCRAHQAFGRIVFIKLAANAAIFPDFTGDAVDEFWNGGVGANTRFHEVIRVVGSGSGLSACACDLRVNG
jgi:hypothetical protein